MGKVLVLDNYDSFTYNLVHLLHELGCAEIDVVRNDKIDLAAVETYDRVVLSPGPGLPSEAGLMPELVKRYADKKRILGVCLGHQCIGEIFGARLLNLPGVVHGKASTIEVRDGGDLLFRGLPGSFSGGRYHSWVVDQEGLPECLKVTAVDGEGRIMAMRHERYDVRGLQFHPESVLTATGPQILRNWLEQ